MGSRVGTVGRAWAWVVMIGWSGWAGGCAWSESPSRGNSPVNTGLNAALRGDEGVAVPPVSGGAEASATRSQARSGNRPAADAATRPGETPLEELARQSALNLQSVLEELSRREVARPPAGVEEREPVQLARGFEEAGGDVWPRSQPETAREASAGQVSPASSAPGPPDQRPDPPSTNAPPAAPEVGTAARVDALSADLREALHAAATGASAAEARRARVILAMLEAIDGTEGEEAAGEREKPVRAGDPLTPQEREAVAWAGRVAAMVARETGTPDDLLDGLADLERRVAEARGLRITRACVCTRVAGFGRFLPIHPRRLGAGQSHRVIVYVEVRGFRQRTASAEEAQAGEVWTDPPAPAWAAELSQELHLYHEADGVLAWSVPRQRVVDVSANLRRDFYLVQPVVLPASLTIGAYRLKVTVRDETAGTQDEAVIPLEIVADPGIARGSER